MLVGGGVGRGGTVHFLCAQSITRSWNVDCHALTVTAHVVQGICHASLSSTFRHMLLCAILVNI